MTAPTRYRCSDERRLEAVRAGGVSNGIDFLEVVDGPGVPEPDRQRLLRVAFANPPSAALRTLTPDRIRLTGGDRVRGIGVSTVEFDGDVLVVRVDRPGDFSRYTLALLRTPSEDLDARLSEVEFSFKVECPNHFDCAGACQCATAAVAEPEIDYLALDYASLRQLMLDRLAVTAPGWTERNPADLGVALVEVLAYAGDHLAYQLDATTTEATLATARRRTSVRRHARLVDYPVPEGVNARTWVHVELADGAGPITLPAGTQLLTRVAGQPRILTDPSPAYTETLAAAPVIFETMESRTLTDTHNRFDLYAWGDRNCCLPAGATGATLLGAHPDLHAGDVLVLTERLGPTTGQAADADPTHRYPVRLIADAVVTIDPIGSWFRDPVLPVTAVEVTELNWAAEDALPFDLCVSATTPDGTFQPAVSGVLGNIVLADHGRTRTTELPEVPTAGRFAPALPEPDLTRTGTLGRPLRDRFGHPLGDPRRPARFDPGAPAGAALGWADQHVLPAVTLTDPAAHEVWYPRPDLLGSDGFAAEFVAETEADGRTTLRFGDGQYARTPRPGTKLHATYRTGTGAAGNIGANALWHVVTELGGISTVSNPLPAVGGTDPEPLERVRQNAPVAFRTPERAVTPDDCAAMALRHPDVAHAVCRRRWTGSWYTMFLSVDRREGRPVDDAFEQDLRAHLDRYRMAGHDLEISPPVPVALELALTVCVLPDYHRSDVELAIGQVLGRGRHPDGRPQFFHPDNLTFGTAVRLSAILAAVQAVPGVHHVTATTFQRLGLAASSALESGVLECAALEIPELDNDPNFAERGTLTLTLEGGR